MKLLLAQILKVDCSLIKTYILSGHVKNTKGLRGLIRMCFFLTAPLIVVLSLQHPDVGSVRVFHSPKPGKSQVGSNIIQI